jgi:hypothetical protein
MNVAVFVSPGIDFIGTERAGGCKEKNDYEAQSEQFHVASWLFEKDIHYERCQF